MTVQDLISRLQVFDPNMKINFQCEVESGRSNSVCTDGQLSTMEINESNELVVRIWGDEDED